MLDKVPLTLLRAFEAAGRAGSFRAASEELALTPSAVSHAIRKLEVLLGVTLFFRTGRTIELTPEGYALFEMVSRGFQEIRDGLQMISTRNPNLLRLHSAPSFATQWLTPRLRKFFADNPGLDIRLAANTTYADFSESEFDADIFYGVPKQEGVEVISLGEETVTPLCAPGVAELIKGVDDLFDQILIQSDNKMIRWSDWFRANKLRSPEPQGPRFDRSYLAIAAAADGLGVALESTRLAEQELQDGRLVRPLKDTCVDVRYQGHYLIYSQAMRNRTSIRMFREWLLAELDSYNKPPG